MMLPDFETLYAPYSAKASLDETLDWLTKEARSRKIEDSIIQQTILETFLEMASGKTFPTDGGNTGFDGYPHAALNHYLLAKVIENNLVAQTQHRKFLETGLKNAILKHIDNLNEQFIAENTIIEEIQIERKKLKFLDLTQSPILKLFGYKKNGS